MQQKGIKVIPFSNGKEALAAMDSLEFDMVITDIQLPEMNGFYFVTIFNEKYKNTPIPVLAITGRRDVPESSYTQSGFSGILPKPFSPEQFYTKLNTFFPKIEVQFSDTKKNLVDTEKYHPEALEDFMGKNKESITALYESFIKETTDNILKMKEAVKAKNYETVQAIAHKMLSMFGQIKAKREVEILNHLNHISKKNVLGIEPKIELLEKLFQQECKAAIEKYCNSLD